MLLALLEEVRFKEQVQVEGEEGERLQQEEELLKERLAGPLRQGKETPRVVVCCYNVCEENQNKIKNSSHIRHHIRHRGSYNSRLTFVCVKVIEPELQRFQAETGKEKKPESVTYKLNQLCAHKI